MSPVFAARAKCIQRLGAYRLVVHARLNGVGDFPLLVDPGADCSLISYYLKGELGLKGGRPASLGVTGCTKSVPTTAYPLGSLSLLAKEGVPLDIGPGHVLLVSLHHWEEKMYQGVIGMDWLGTFERVCFALSPASLDLYFSESRWLDR